MVIKDVQELQLFVLADVINLSYLRIIFFICRNLLHLCLCHDCTSPYPYLYLWCHHPGQIPFVPASQLPPSIFLFPLQSPQLSSQLLLWGFVDVRETWDEHPPCIVCHKDRSQPSRTYTVSFAHVSYCTAVPKDRILSHSVGTEVTLSQDPHAGSCNPRR